MKYTYVEFGDHTVVTYNDIREDRNGEHIALYFEQPCEGGFRFLETSLPDLNIVNSSGYTADEIHTMLNFARNNESLIWELAREQQTDGDSIANAI